MICRAHEGVRLAHSDIDEYVRGPPTGGLKRKIVESVLERWERKDRGDRVDGGVEQVVCKAN